MAYATFNSKEIGPRIRSAIEASQYQTSYGDRDDIIKLQKLLSLLRASKEITLDHEEYYLIAQREG